MDLLLRVGLWLDQAYQATTSVTSLPDYCNRSSEMCLFYRPLIDWFPDPGNHGAGQAKSLTSSFDDFVCCGEARTCTLRAPHGYEDSNRDRTVAPVALPRHQQAIRVIREHKDSKKSGPLKAIVVSRPSKVAARSYEQVTRAYFGAVHSVLTGERRAPEAAAELEKYLVKITGFRTGPPEKN